MKSGVTMKVQKLVVTRLTIKLFYDSFAPEWLEERLRLFRTYCVPGMARQTRTDHLWLVLCDETTDEGFIERLQGFRSVVPQLRVALTSRERNIRIPDVMADSIDEDTELLITARLDGDDSFHEEAMAVVGEYVEAFAGGTDRRWLLNFPRGYRYHEQDGRLFECHWLNSPFATMFEKLRPGKGFSNVYLNHHKLHLDTPVHFDQSIPAWLQTIHGRAEESERGGTAVAAGNTSSRGSKDDVEVDPEEIRGFGVDLAKARAEAD
jgi:putative rhamnosyltransferase